MIRHRPGALGVLAVLGAFLAMSTAPAAEEDLRRFLKELSIQVPSREATAPGFSIPGLNGTPVRLADHTGRPVMLYFWTTY